MTITLDLLALALRIRLQRFEGSSALLLSSPRAGDHHLLDGAGADGGRVQIWMDYRVY